MRDINAKFKSYADNSYFLLDTIDKKIWIFPDAIFLNHFILLLQRWSNTRRVIHLRLQLYTVITSLTAGGGTYRGTAGSISS